MSEYIVFLITFARIVKYDPEAGQASELIKVALKVHRDDLPRDDAWMYPRECQANLRLMLPLHCRDLGPIVDIEVIFEAEDRSQDLLLREARDAIVALTNELDPECELCGGTTEHDGSGHRARCIANRLTPGAGGWQPYDDHDKLEKRWYDVRSPDGEVWEHYWPNAGQLTCARGTEQVRVPPNAGFEVRPSKTHPADKGEKPPGPASPPQPQPAHEPPGKIMVLHERAPTCYWHAGCACFPSPPMAPGSKRCPCHIQLKCTHCGRVALKPRNQSGMVLCDEVD